MFRSAQTGKEFQCPEMLPNLDMIIKFMTLHIFTSLIMTPMYVLVVCNVVDRPLPPARLGESNSHHSHDS